MVSERVYLAATPGVLNVRLILAASVESFFLHYNYSGLKLGTYYVVP